MAVVANKAKRPNVMIIFADDLGTGDVPGYWNNSGLVDMPNFENLVNTGTTFLDAHSTPLCAPSRYVLLSGNYQHKGRSQLGTWNLNYKGSQFRDGQQSIAQVFRDKGYNTAIYGKWHLGGKILIHRCLFFWRWVFLGEKFKFELTVMIASSFVS